MALNRAERLKILRILNGYSAKDLALALNISPSTVTLWEREGPKGLVPGGMLLSHLSELLGVSPDYLHENPLNFHGVNNCIWRPVASRAVQFQRAMSADILSLLPELLSENEINFGDFARLADGYAYLLGRDICKNKITRDHLPPDKKTYAIREDREFTCLLLASNNLANCLNEALQKNKNIDFLPGQSLQHYTLDTFDRKGLQILASGGNYAKIDFRPFTHALETSTPRHGSQDLVIKKTKLRERVFSLILALNHDRLSDDTVSAISDLFMDKLEMSEISEFDLSSEIFKILNKNG